MGQNVQAGEALQTLLEHCEEMVLKEAVPRYLYRVVSIEETQQGVAITGTKIVLYGNDIKKHLHGCRRAILMCATLSSGIDRLIRTSQKRDIAEAFAIDALASTAIEQLCEKVGDMLSQIFPEYFLTWRYGVGYGDFPIEQQTDVLLLLDAQKKIGLNETATHMLTPGKSVTAVIGLSDKKTQPHGRGCDSCRLNGTCRFRKEGTYCNDQTIA